MSNAAAPRMCRYCGRPEHGSAECGAMFTDTISEAVRELKLVECPFCGDTDFDLAGLKSHLERDCEKYAATEMPRRVFG